MHIVTAGAPFMDIDAYAASIAFAELLRLQGEDALAASSAPLNASVTPSLQKLDAQFERNYKPSKTDVFTIVDLSDPDYFDLGATAKNVVGVIDHHQGYVDFWKEKLGDKAQIEFIGAACTLVYELWQKAGQVDQMSKNSAVLLACGILDNTLNLTAPITTDRDRNAYAILAKHANLSTDWPEHYFRECQDYILADVEQALENDTKPLQYPKFPHTVSAGQLALWDAKNFIHESRDAVRKLLAAQNPKWYLNLIDISSARSIFFCEDPQMQRWLADLLDLEFEQNIATANRTWLRKEIMQQALQR